jgi:hypothetical protein
LTDPRQKCSRCGTLGSDGEPPLCHDCFLAEYRHDPACADSIYAEFYCGGAEAGCATCVASDGEPMTRKGGR